MTDIRSLGRRLLDNLPFSKARIEFVAWFLLTLYAMRTVNLSIMATGLWQASVKELKTEKTWLSSKKRLPSRSQNVVPLSDRLRALRCRCPAKSFQIFVCS